MNPLKILVIFLCLTEDITYLIEFLLGSETMCENLEN